MTDKIARHTDLMSLLLGFHCYIAFLKLMMRPRITQGYCSIIQRKKVGSRHLKQPSGLIPKLGSCERSMLVSLTEIAPDIDQAVEKIETMDRVNKTSELSQKQIRPIWLSQSFEIGKDKEALLEMVILRCFIQTWYNGSVA